MADIEPINVFASSGERNTDGLTLANGFPAAQKPARQWFNWLFNGMTTKINELITAVNSINNIQKDEPIKVGDTYITTINHANAAKVAEHHGYGTWGRTGEGTHLSLAGTSDGVTLVGGAVSGSHTHGITVDELPNFRLKNGVADEAAGPSDTSCHVYGSTTDDMPNLATSGVQNAGGQTAYQGYTSAIGGDQAMPIRPRTTTYYGWVRLT